MPIRYEQVVPWGRSLREYEGMFHLTDADLRMNILDCGGGPASFNAEMRKRNPVISFDPIYYFSKEEISRRIDETRLDVLNQTEKNKEKFIWKNIKNIRELDKIRTKAMKLFLEDFEKGLAEKRYIAGELPELPFKDGQFDIALSSHFLFLYTDNLTLDFHIQAIKSMCRTAREVRIFPILDANAKVSEYLTPVIDYFQKDYQVEIKKVDYEFQKNGNEMLSIKKEINGGHLNGK